MTQSSEGTAGNSRLLRSSPSASSPDTEDCRQGRGCQKSPTTKKWEVIHSCWRGDTPRPTSLGPSLPRTGGWQSAQTSLPPPAPRAQAVTHCFPASAGSSPSYRIQARIYCHWIRNPSKMFCLRGGIDNPTPSGLLCSYNIKLIILMYIVEWHLGHLQRSSKITLILFQNKIFIYLFTYQLWCVLSHSVMSSSLRHNGLQSTRLFCPWEYPRQEY